MPLRQLVFFEQMHHLGYHVGSLLLIRAVPEALACLYSQDTFLWGGCLCTFICFAGSH